MQDVPEATIGVIINRPTDIKVFGGAKSTAGKGATSPRVFFGGEYYANEAHAFLTRTEGLKGGKQLGESGMYLLDMKCALEAVNA